MTIKDIVITENFNFEVKKYLELNKLDKTIFVTTKQLHNYYVQKINDILTYKNVKLVTLPDNLICNEFSEKMFLNYYDNDVKVVIVFAPENIINIVKYCLRQSEAKYIIIPSSCSDGNFVTNYCYCFEDYPKKINCMLPISCIIDKSVIYKSSNKKTASCYGQLISNYISVLDCVFKKCINSQVVNNENLFEVEKVLNKVINLPSTALISKHGKFTLLYLKIYIELLFNEIKTGYQTAESIALLMQHFIDYKLSFGECLMISALTSASVICGLNNIKNLSVNYLSDFFNRNKKLKQSLNINFQNVFDIDNKDEKSYLIKRFFVSKEKLYALSLKYYNNIVKANLIFKNFYNDKGVFINKILNKETILMSVSLVPDVYNCQSVLEFLQIFGLLNFYTYSKKPNQI